MAIALASRIERVTVFRSGARVERVAELPPADGGAEGGVVRLVRLPLTLDDGSIRARVEGEGVATDLRVALEVPPADVTLSAPKNEELVAAQLEVARLRAEVERVNAMILRVQAIAVLARPKGKEGEPPVSSPMEARRALVAFRTEEQARLALELSALEQALSRAERASAALKDRAARATTARNPKDHELWKSVLVTLDGAAKGLLRVEYMVPGARWSPSYSLEIAASGKGAQLALRAAVAQRTGEDWTAANLVLSTADAEKWTELPVLKSVRIGRAQRAKPQRGWRAPPEGAAELYADYDRAFGPPRPARTDISEMLAREVSDDAVTTRFDASDFDQQEDTPVEDMRTLAGARSYGAPAAPGRPMAGTGAPPPPMAAAPMMMPQSLARPVPPPARSAAPMGEAGMVSDALEAAPMMKRRMMGPRDAPAPRRAAPDTPPGPSGLDLEALAYGRLRMLDPGSSARGSLVAASAASLYIEAGGGVAVSLDVLTLIRVAIQRSNISDGALPPGHEPLARQGDFDYAYQAPTVVTVPSDGVFHVLPLGTHQAESRVHYVTVPRESHDVFRVLELTSPIDAALLRGPIDVYQRGTYLMTSRLPPTGPRGKVRLGLGVEQAIKVARNTTFAEKSTGLLGGGLSLVHEIEVELANGMERPVEVEVRERLPTVQEDDKDVEIAVEVAEPAWKEWTQEQSLKGGFRWSVTMEAAQKRKLYAKYVVKISAKHELAGGNRREA